MAWTEHTAANGKTYYYDRISGKSQWQRPISFKHLQPDRISLAKCIDEEPVVARLLNTIIASCGVSAVPTVDTRSVTDSFCDGGRGGAYCCASNRIYLCRAPWVGCREVAYELSHALNVCRGKVRCTSGGMDVDGADCGYFSPPEVACSELRAAHWTGRCAARTTEVERGQCLKWHARWAVQSCFPDDENLEAHVRYATTKCSPGEGDLAKGLSTYVDQYFRFD